MSLRTLHLRYAAPLALAGALTVGGCANTVSTQQEVQLGAQHARQINQQLPIVRDAAVHRYINELGNTIAQRVDSRGINYTFYVVNSDVVNAFALPGGHIYINRGLITRTANLSELAGVLGHEIAHVVERHGLEQMAKAQQANLGLSVLYGVLLGRQPSTVEQVAIQGGGTAVFAGYTRDAEREADAQAVHYMVAAGIHPQGLVSMFETLMQERQRNPSGVAAWFSTHPGTEERITNVQRDIAALPAGSLNGLATDNRAFQQFRQRVSQQPAAPRR